MAEAMAEGRGLKPSIAHYNLSILANVWEWFGGADARGSHRP